MPRLHVPMPQDKSSCDRPLGGFQSSLNYAHTLSKVNEVN